MAYCEVVDLQIGDIPTSARLDPQKYVNDAADEIDSKIGFVYATPIPVENGSLTPRPVVLLLKRINSHLATGRMVLAATLISEDQRLNAFGQSMVEEALAAIVQIATLQIPLDGVPSSGLATGPSPHVPLQYNKDTESAVDAFYDRVVAPSYTFVRPYGSGYGF